MNKNNKGFSLVEVLIAMTVLAIIVVPLLRAFSTSANVNAKAARLMNANNIAQNIIEELKAEGLEAIEEAGYVKADILKDADKDVYTGRYIYDSAEGFAVGESSYDVEVLVKPNEHGTKEFASMNSMNEPDCAYYAQPEDLDQRAAEKFQIRNLAYTYDATAQLDSEAFKALMNREIRLDITANTVDVTYTYTIPYSESGTKYAAPEDSVYEERITIFDNKISGEELEAVYLYYYPSFSNGAESIKIVKPKEVEIDLYLLEMEIEGATATDLAKWRPDIISIDATTNTSYAAKLNTNIDKSIYGFTPDSMQADAYIQPIGNLKATDVLFDVTIRVYTHQDPSTRYMEKHMVEEYESTYLKYD